MLEIDEDSRLGRELISGGARYSAGLVPNDDTIAQMYEEAVTAFASAGLEQYEISNFARSGAESKHNLRYWQRRPYLGLGLDASSMLRSADGSVLRATTTDDLSAYVAGDSQHETPWHETAWHGLGQQLEEAWFLGLRRNAGVETGALRAEFGDHAVELSLEIAHRLAEEGLLSIEADTIRLTPRGRLISNDVFSEFLDMRTGMSTQLEEMRGHSVVSGK
jgi:oxygen-independent coproporphyrinogen-3 oxidase